MDQLPEFSTTVIGIVDNDMIEEDEETGDFSDGVNKGYGLFLCSMLKYHGDEDYGSAYDYAEQFEIEKNDTITMQLDMTQQISDKGLLFCSIHSKTKSDIKEVRTDGQYSNVLYEVDINKKWRAAVAIKRYSDDIISLLSY